MKNDIETKFLLSVFEKIRQHGEYKDFAYRLEGVKAFTDHDGYTVFLEDAQVKMRVGFHNQYHLDYDKAEHKEAFTHKLESIAQNY